MNNLMNETFFKVLLVICLIPVAILVGKAFLLFSPLVFWILGYMAFKKGNQNETIMWVIFAVLGLILAFVIQNKQSTGDVVELADTLDLGSSAERRGGSTPSIPTIFNLNYYLVKYTLHSINVKYTLQCNTEIRDECKRTNART